MYNTDFFFNVMRFMEDFCFFHFFVCVHTFVFVKTNL